MSDTANAGASGGASTTATTTGTPSTTTTSDWTSGMDEATRGYVQTKGFKGVGEVVESYKNFEKMHGVPQDRLIKIPEKLEGDDARSVFQRLGMPKDAKDYNVKIPKEMGDEAAAQKIRDFAFKNNMTNRQVEALVENEVADWTARNASQTQAAELANKNAQDNLKKEWGAAFEQNKNIADQGAISIGMSNEQVQALGAALGPDGALKLLHKIATATGESPYVSGQNPGAGVNTPASANAKITELMQDIAFGNRLSNGDTDAKALWERLHKEAYPENRAN